MSHRRLAGSALALSLVLVTGSASALNDGRLGSQCDVDDDCSGGLTCLRPDTYGVGPAGGLCSAPCANAADCAAYDELSKCLQDDACADCEGYCVETCVAYQAAGDTLDPTKCHGRDDMKCTWDCDDCVSHCDPQCAVDEQCGAGFFCDVAGGLCVDYQPDTDPPGSACDFDNYTCAGWCDVDRDASLKAGRVVGICVEPCVVGSPIACASQQSRAPLRACVGHFSWSRFGGETPGDVGACADLCNCTNDCAEDAVCEPTDFGGRYPALGVCVTEPKQPDAPDCLKAQPEAGAGSTPDCKYGAVRACKVGDCLGTADCLPNGAYSECRCSDAGGGAGEGGGPSARPTSEVVQSHDAGCGCRVTNAPGSAASSALLTLLAALVLRFRWRGRSARF